MTAERLVEGAAHEGRAVDERHARLPLTVPLDLRRTLGPLLRGAGDPTMRFDRDGSVWRATRTADGPATVRLRASGGEVGAVAWGPGANIVLEGLPALLGLDDDPGALVPPHRIVRDLQRRLPGVRFGRTGAVLESLVPAILEQKVTGGEARSAYRLLVRRYGSPAPGPGGLMLPPRPDVLASLPYHAFHPLGVERRRADFIRIVASRAGRIESTTTLVAAGRHADAYRILRAFPGVGQWTAAEVGQRVYGDPDAVSVGDFHIPSLVSWALAGEPRADDARMLELLEPYRGQRARVVRLLEASGIQPPRYGPRFEGRSFRHF